MEVSQHEVLSRVAASSQPGIFGHPPPGAPSPGVAPPAAGSVRTVGHDAPVAPAGSAAPYMTTVPAGYAVGRSAGHTAPPDAASAGQGAAVEYAASAVPAGSAAPFVATASVGYTVEHTGGHAAHVVSAGFPAPLMYDTSAGQAGVVGHVAPSAPAGSAVPYAVTVPAEYVRAAGHVAPSGYVSSAGHMAPPGVAPFGGHVAPAGYFASAGHVETAVPRQVAGFNGALGASVPIQSVQPGGYGQFHQQTGQPPPAFTAMGLPHALS